jgi:hypothetical protein
VGAVLCLSHAKLCKDTFIFVNRGIMKIVFQRLSCHFALSSG